MNPVPAATLAGGRPMRAATSIPVVTGPDEAGREGKEEKSGNEAKETESLLRQERHRERARAETCRRTCAVVVVTFSTCGIGRPTSSAVRVAVC